MSNQTPARKHNRITVGPYATNVLDLIGREDLVRPDGTSIKVLTCGNGFRLCLGKFAKVDAVDNIDASYILNMWEVGTWERT